FEREQCRGGGVVEVDPGPHAAPVTDDWKLALANRLDRAVVGGAVEDPVAQNAPAELRDSSLEMGDRGCPPFEVFRRCRVDRIVLASSRSSLTGFAPSVRSSSALPGETCVPITSWPASISWETSRLPIAPLAPTTRTRIVSPFSGHLPRLSRV